MKKLKWIFPTLLPFCLFFLHSGFTSVQDISGQYSLSGNQGRVILITKVTDNIYLIEEPGGSWPWQGSAVFDGKMLAGTAKFRSSRQTMLIKATYRAFDKALEDVSYVYATDKNGNLLNKIGSGCGGRVDTHIWKRM